MQFLMFYRLVFFMREARKTLRKLSPVMASKNPDSELHRMPTAALKQFVLDWTDNRIFSTHHMSEADSRNSLIMVFMPMMCGLEHLAPWAINDINCIWEHMDKAGPRSINGMPGFFSMHLLHKKDADIVFPAIKRESERRDHIQL
jgi:hypothetical protein